MASWIEGTLAQAIDQLAKRATVMREIRQLKKQAIDWSSLKDTLTSAPVLGGLAGAGGGALLGGLSSLGKDPEERDTTNNVLTGALAGAGLGTGLGFASPYITGAKEMPSWMPGVSPKVQADLDQLNAEARKRMEQHAQNAPSWLGSMTWTGLSTAPLVGWDASRFRVRPDDIRAGASNVPRGDVKVNAGKTKFKLKEFVDKQMGKMTPDEQRNAMKWIRQGGNQSMMDKLFSWMSPVRDFEVKGYKPLSFLPTGNAPTEPTQLTRPPTATGKPAGVKSRAKPILTREELMDMGRIGRNMRTNPSATKGIIPSRPMSGKGAVGRGLLALALPTLLHAIRTGKYDFSQSF